MTHMSLNKLGGPAGLGDIIAGKLIARLALLTPLGSLGQGRGGGGGVKLSECALAHPCVRKSINKFSWIQFSNLGDS